MSYPRDLEDYSDSELAAELARRCAERSLGKCDYCHQGKARDVTKGCSSGRHGRTEHMLRADLKKFGVIP